MNAKEFFWEIVVPNHQEAIDNPTDLRRTYNAIITMNTMAEFLALDKLGYVEGLTEKELANAAGDIRDQYPVLETLKHHAEKMKHVRKLRGADPKPTKIDATASSTAYDTTDFTTWEHLRPVLECAMSVLKTIVI